MDFKQAHAHFRLQGLDELYLPPSELEKHLYFLDLETEEFGRSEEGRPLRFLEIGQGPIPVLCWSQMHGNESTATKVFLDILNSVDDPLWAKIKQMLRIRLIPMLNPDGALRHIRFNATDIDLNRDFVDSKSAEMKAFRKLVEEFQPKWAFNMHDQRNIFAVGDSFEPATIAFLSPSVDASRSLTDEREDVMRLASVILNELSDLDRHISRFTDEFYPAATGDNLQKMGIKTLLIESGPYPNDPSRFIAREAAYRALMSAFVALTSGGWTHSSLTAYLGLPENKKALYDIVLKTKGKEYGVLLKHRVVDGHFESYYELEHFSERKRGYKTYVSEEGRDIKEGEVNLKELIEKGNFKLDIDQSIDG